MLLRPKTQHFVSQTDMTTGSGANKAEAIANMAPIEATQLLDGRSLRRRTLETSFLLLVRFGCLVRL